MAFQINGVTVINDSSDFSGSISATTVNDLDAWTETSEVTVGGFGSWAATVINTYTEGLQPSHNDWTDWWLYGRVGLIGGTGSMTSAIQMKVRDIYTTGDSNYMIIYPSGQNININSHFYIHFQNIRDAVFGQSSSTGGSRVLATPYYNQIASPTKADATMIQKADATGVSLIYGNGGEDGPIFSSASSTDHSYDISFPTYSGGSNLSWELSSVYK